MRDFSSSTGRSCPALPKHRGRRLLGSIFGRPHGTINELEFWRERILWAIFAGGVAMSPLALLPAVMMLLDSGHYQMVFIDIAAVIFACVLLRLRGSIPYLLRAGIAVLIVYTVGLGVILTVGIASGGSAWLFCFAVLAGVLLGVKGAFWALSLNAVTFAFLGYFSWRGSLAIGSVFQSDVQAAVAGINFLFLNAVCAISVAVLVRGMENAANRERAVALDLEQSRTRLSIIFDHAAVGLVETELNGRLTRVNRFFAELLGQVLMNLCTNAGHAMATGGVLTVALTELDHTSGSEASLTCSGPCVRLTVSDTGCGMTAEVLERIFDPFFTTKGADKGTGLGLSVVHGIIKSHGGSISAVSTPDQGSVFTIDLPIIQSDSRRKAQETLPLPHGTESVLWVDDEPFQVELGCEFLQRLGYRVEGRDRADEALELFRAAPYDFDLVITDMTMPRMTGEVLSSAILAIRPDIPVILCTGYSEQISEPQAVAKGIAAFAFKPIELAELAQLVRRVLNERSTARALRSHD